MDELSGGSGSGCPSERTRNVGVVVEVGVDVVVDGGLCSDVGDPALTVRPGRTPKST